MGSKRVYFVSGYRIGAVNPSSANHWHAGHGSSFSPTGSSHFVLKNAVYGLEQTISSLGVHCVNIIKLKKFLRQSAVCIAGVIVNFHLGQRDHLESGFLFVDGKLSLRKLPSTCAKADTLSIRRSLRGHLSVLEYLPPRHQSRARKLSLPGFDRSSK